MGLGDVTDYRMDSGKLGSGVCEKYLCSYMWNQKPHRAGKHKNINLDKTWLKKAWWKWILWQSSSLSRQLMGSMGLSLVGREPTIASLFDFFMLFCYYIWFVCLFMCLFVCGSMWRPEDDLGESALSTMWAPGIELRSRACWHVSLPAESFYGPSFDGFKACL